VSTGDLSTLIETYRTDLESELVLIVRLQSVAARQHEATALADIEGLQRAATERDTLTAELMTIEDQLRPLQQRLTRERTAALRLPGFNHAVSLHQTVAQMVKDILETDRDSIRVLEQIVTARRAAARTAADSAEQAEATLIAYGRMAVAPPMATLVNRRG
jgi:hypothetical protein